MITLPAFIKLFSKNDHNISKGFVFFLKNAKVVSGKSTYSLKEYVDKKKINNADLKIIFENIKHKNEYLIRFYNTSLLYDRKNISIDETPMKSHHFNNNSLVQYKNIIRNTFFYEILRDTKSGFNNPSYLEVIDDLYNKYIIHVHLLAPSSLDYIKKGRIGSVFSSLFFRASIMNPYLVFSLNQSIFRAKTVFTPTLGWSSYYYGFAESGIEEYVGVDVIPNVCSKVSNFAEKFYPHIKTDIYCTPSESLLKNTGFLKKYKKHFDVIFFSPPYFMLEKYPGKKQSTVLYETLDEWLDKYWEKTIQLCSIVLKNEGILSYILSDYGSLKNKESHFELVKLMNDISKKYFKTVHIQPMYNKNVMVTGARHRETNEKIMFFSK
jgi:hypothetical protein